MGSDDYNIVIEGGSIANCSPDWEWKHRPGSHLFNLWFVYRGKGVLTSNVETYKLSRGDCFLLRHSQSQHGCHDPDNCLIVPYILFVCLDENNRQLDEGIFPETHYHVEDPNLMYSVMKRCLDYYARGKLQEAAQWLKTALLELRVSDMSHYSGLQMEQYNKINKLCRRICEKPGNSWKTSELARECGYTTDHFIRLFKKYCGTTPNDYIINARIQEAESLLMFSEHSISRIADILGYSDEFCFSRQFKSRRGISPSKFKASKRNSSK
ncbi:MAG: helix-turn-helix transcriptional regulator [Lentisphaerae bacterium]|nr:helix-turn-helix transcriptional regulator [Lentisphaerota bacterium]MCP4103815.1 helix-turn-helix transcriptional regulator [Lentisphaerota bacterium]